MYDPVGAATPQGRNKVDIAFSSIRGYPTGVGPPLKFRFNFDKFVSALGFLLDRCGPMTKLKIVKLLYLADRRHFNQYGRPVIGDRYIRMGLGPVPTVSKELIDQLEEDVMLHIRPAVEGKELAKYFKVDRKQRYPLISLGKAPSCDSLSESDLEALEWVAKEYGKLKASSLVNLTHRHAAWKETESLGEIDYRLFPKDDKAATKGVVELAEAEQMEKAEVIAAFSRVTPTRPATKALLAAR